MAVQSIHLDVGLMLAARHLRDLQKRIQWNPESVPTLHCAIGYCTKGCHLIPRDNGSWLRRQDAALAYQRFREAEDFRVTVYRADGSATGPGA